MLILKAPQSEVIAAIQRVSGITPARSTLVVMSNLLLQKSGDTLSITSSDLDIQATATATLGGDAGEFATTVSAKRIADVLKAVPGDQVVSLTSKDEKLILQAGKSRFTMQTLPADHFPVMNAVQGAEIEIQMAQGKLLTLLQQVSFAMAEHDVRHYINGALLVVEGDSMTAVGTNGKHLAKISAAVTAPDCYVIVPRPSVLQLVKMLAPKDDPVTIRIAANLATFEFSGLQFITKLIEGRFPDYKRAIPKSLANSVTLGRAPLLHALRSVAIMTDQKFKAMRLKFAPGELTLRANVGAEDAESTIEIDYAGPELDLGFDAKMLADGLSSVDEDMVRLDMAPEAPLLLSLPNGDASFRYALSPLRM